MLGEDLSAVQEHFETSAGGGLQLQGGDPVFELFQNFPRQTDGVRHVISGGAIFNFDRHPFAPLVNVALGHQGQSIAESIRRFPPRIPLR